MSQQPVREQRRTRQRAAVDEVLDEVDDFVSAQELHQMLRARGSQVGLATVCRSCGAAVEISRPAVEAWAEDVARAHGYVDVTHTVEIFGLCPRCAALSSG